MPMHGFMPICHDAVLARSLRQPVRMGIEGFPPRCAEIWDGPGCTREAAMGPRFPPRDGLPGVVFIHGSHGWI